MDAKERGIGAAADSSGSLELANVATIRSHLMSARIHPNDALFQGEKPFPIINTCEHFAGSEKLIEKAMELQQKLEGIFDITMDCEDGAKQGEERKHAEMVVAMAKSSKNVKKKAGVRIHDYSNAHWKQDVDILVPGAGAELAYITLPKPTRTEQVAEQIAYIQAAAKKANIQREIPIHVLVETHGALRDAYQIAALPWVQVLDFGLMDFVSGFHGAVGSENMRSPGQFEHRAIAYGKARVVSAALFTRRKRTPRALATSLASCACGRSTRRRSSRSSMR
jgi:citrate lyase subunit beta/citryl-CoA lyase